MPSRLRCTATNKAGSQGTLSTPPAQDSRLHGDGRDGANLRETQEATLNEVADERGPTDFLKRAQDEPAEENLRQKCWRCQCSGEQSNAVARPSQFYVSFAW
uniref:Uncharacterized protein n=1 Tax=Sphaerodactylus townsendi TaxID=933632 RepID=A0ACB8FKI7_9SAUR